MFSSVAPVGAGSGRVNLLWKKFHNKSRPWAWGGDADQGVTLTGSKADDIVVKAFPAFPRDDSDLVSLVDPTFRR
jgi:hypothetical protein